LSRQKKVRIKYTIRIVSEINRRIQKLNEEKKALIKEEKEIQNLWGEKCSQRKAQSNRKCAIDTT